MIFALDILYPKVKECAIVGLKDWKDGIIKPYAVIELQKGVEQSDFLKMQIEKFFEENAQKNEITCHFFPAWIGFVPKLPKKKDGTINMAIIQKNIKNWSELFIDESTEQSKEGCFLVILSRNIYYDPI